MNDILFTGRCKKDKKWIEGLLTKDLKGHSRIQFDVKYFSVVVDTETVGIYIGISDKRGAKLFVGSIFSYTEHAGYNMSSFTAEVVFDKECASFGYRLLGLTALGVKHEMIHHFCEHDELSVDVLPYVEVIGNIHDKPLQP